MNCIAIYRTKTCWMASWRLTDQYQEMMRLFGTTDIPTAFTAHAAEETVNDTIARLNPGYSVFRTQDVR